MRSPKRQKSPAWPIEIWNMKLGFLLSVCESVSQWVSEFSFHRAASAAKNTFSRFTTWVFKLIFRVHELSVWVCDSEYIVTTPNNLNLTQLSWVWHDYEFANHHPTPHKLYLHPKQPQINIQSYLGVISKNNSSIFKDIIQIEVDPPPLPTTPFLTIFFLTKCWSCWPPSLP